ncbi:MAG: hypothetical protein P4L93_09870 [Coriobacteriia bacterium]|nr:hypothetical protein [Coriobacteriia bacterium]
MRHFRFAIFAVVSALLVLGFAQSALAQKTWQVTQLTSAPYEHDNLALSGDRVVWREQTPGGPLWTWTPTEATHTISNDDAVATAPSVDGNRVVWTGYFAATGYSQRVWTAGSGESSVAPVYSFGGDPNAPKISGTRVAWVDRPNGDLISHVYSRDLDETSVTVVSNNTWPIYDPISVSGNRIAWDCSTDGHSNNIFTRVVGDAGQKQLTNHAGIYDAAYSPEVSGDRVVWVDNVGDWIVRVWKSDDTSMAVGPLANDGWLDPHISGERIVWRSPDGSGVGQVTTLKLGDLAPSVLTTGGTSNSDHAYQQVSGDRVVWREFDGSVYRVMTWAMGDSRPTTLSGDYSANDPQVSGDRVVWQGYVGGYQQIFTAVLAEQPVPTPIATSLTKPGVSPSKPTHGKYATFTAYLTPSDAGVAGSKGMLQLYHQETKTVRKKVGGKWRKVKVKYWRLRKTAGMTGASASGGRWQLSARVKLAYKGSWKATVTATAAGNYLLPALKTLTFSAK